MTTENNTAEQPKETALTLKHAMLSQTFKKTEATRFLELIDEEVMKEHCDPTTTKGQARERSLAAGIGSFKQHMNRLALASIEKHAEIVKATKSYLKEFNANCDERRDARKAPTLKHEADEQERKDRHKNAIEQFRSFRNFEGDIPAERLQTRLEMLEGFDFEKLEEFAEEGKLVAEESKNAIGDKISAILEQAKQAAELKRLQDEAEKRKEDDAKVLADKQKADDLEAEKEQDRLDGIKVKEDADKAEEKRLADIDQAKKDATKATEDRLKKEQDDRDAAAQRVADAKESKRISARNAELERQADKEHRKAVRTEAVEAISGTIEISLHEAAHLIDAIERGDIPNLAINF